MTTQAEPTHTAARGRVAATAGAIRPGFQYFCLATAIERTTGAVHVPALRVFCKGTSAAYYTILF